MPRHAMARLVTSKLNFLISAMSMISSRRLLCDSGVQSLELNSMKEQRSHPVRSPVMCQSGGVSPTTLLVPLQPPTAYNKPSINPAIPCPPHQVHGAYASSSAAPSSSSMSQSGHPHLEESGQPRFDAPHGELRPPLGIAARPPEVSRAPARANFVHCLVHGSWIHSCLISIPVVF